MPTDTCIHAQTRERRSPMILHQFDNRLAELGAGAPLNSARPTPLSTAWPSEVSYLSHFDHPCLRFKVGRPVVYEKGVFPLVSNVCHLSILSPCVSNRCKQVLNCLPPLSLRANCRAVKLTITDVNRKHSHPPINPLKRLYCLPTANLPIHILHQSHTRSSMSSEIRFSHNGLHHGSSRPAFPGGGGSGALLGGDDEEVWS